MADLSTDRLLEFYRWMSLTRTFDDKLLNHWKQGRGVGGAFSQRGHEAISVGVGMALGPDDVVAPLHRDLGTYLVRGMAPERIFANMLGKASGVTGGRDANLHGNGDLSLGIIGFISHLPQALPVTLGVAMSFKHRREPRVAVTFVGDGGTTAGAFHETLNMAGVWQPPLVVIVENNQYAYSTPLDQQMRYPDIAPKIVCYGVSAVTIEGNEVEDVYHAAVAAIERARAGEGPTVIEAKTMRMLGHAIHDGAEYVPAELLEHWRQRDPLLLLRRRLASAGVDESTIAEIDHETASRMDRVIAAAEAAPLPDPRTVFEGVFA